MILRNCRKVSRLFNDNRVILVNFTKFLRNEYCHDASSDGEPKYIDYSVLPPKKKKTDEQHDEEEIRVIQQPEQPIQKRTILRFLRVLNSNKKNFMVKLKSLGLNEDVTQEAMRTFNNDVWKQAEEDENFRYYLQNLHAKKGTTKDVFGFLYNYVKQRYPVLENMDELKSLGDLKNPANWFIEARKMKRNIIFHAGPTNSGKTHNALERFQKSNSGIYGGPLRMLAAEVFERTNANGVLCDMLTGEQRLWAKSELEPSDHVSCTVEMCKNARSYECAVLDEIQLMRDKDRGWGWTSAFLGMPAKEIHICGEPAAEKLISSLIKLTGDELEVRRYKRLTPLHIMKGSIGSFKAVRPGDCVVAFSRNKIFKIRAEIEKATGLKCSVIYGGLPPSIRLEQAKRFNDPNDEHCVLVASDAIGMGINLSIRRLVFSSLKKFDGQNIITLPPYHAKQIAGRAGRHGTEYPQGFVTTLQEKDIGTLQELLTSETDDVEKAGLHPTYEQIEMFSHVLPKASFSELLDTFVRFAELDGNYFMCDIDHLKKVADAIQHIPLTLRQRHDMCSATSDRTNRSSFVVGVAVKLATLFNAGTAIDTRLMKELLRWPPKKARSLEDLDHLESIHDIFDLYLWMSYRYEEIFVDREEVRELQEEIEGLIKMGLDQVVRGNDQKQNWSSFFNNVNRNRKS